MQISRALNAVILVLLTLTASSATADIKPFTYVVKSASGQDYLALFAATCDDNSWKSIEAWATKTKFIDKTLPQVEILYDGQKLKSNTDIKVDVNGETITTTVHNKTYSGSLCEVVAQLITERRSTKTALVELLIPAARAQRRNTEDHTTTTAIATFVGYTGAGCAVGAAGGSVVPVVGTAIGGLAGCSVGAIGGLVSVIGSDIRAETNRDRLEMDLRNFLGRGFPQMRTCTKHAVQAVNGKRTVNLTRTAAGTMIQVREGSKLIYKTKADFLEEELFKWCNSAAKAREFNAKIQAQHKRATARLHASKPQDGSKQRSAR